ncbi:MAG: lipid-A-disaccharide synthase [Acidobacteriota bacterium]|nr:lipid-A-disaccharide synthase [Acidobacteriota bacterium]
MIRELQRRLPHLTCFGLGGAAMASTGLERIVRAEDVAHMGITEVIRHMPSIYAKYRRLVASIERCRPDVAILIDFPDVNFRLARELKKRGIPVLYFVSPQLWAWKRRRLRWVQQRVTRMMVIFPFEAAFYRARNVDATFVGHPLAELLPPAVGREEYAGEHGLDPGKSWIALLPGSRSKEVRLNLPTLLETAGILGEEYEFLLPVASTLSREWVDTLLPSARVPRIHLVPDAREALYHARASIVASGTATVQAALIGNPFVVVYRVSPLTFRLARHLVRYPPEVWRDGPDLHGNVPVAMVNLVAGRRIVPELLQTRFTGLNVAAALTPLLRDTPERAQMMTDLAEVRSKLLPQSQTSSIGQVCDSVEALLPGAPLSSSPKSE